MHPTLKICVAALFEMRAHFMCMQRFVIGFVPNLSRDLLFLR